MGSRNDATFSFLFLSDVFVDHLGAMVLNNGFF
jgi:hypothetical protein